MKRTFALLLAALLLTALLAGCAEIGLKPIPPSSGEAQPAKTEPAKTEPAKTEPAKHSETEAPETEPAETEAPTAASEAEPAKTEAPTAAPVTEPPKTEPDKTEPVVYTDPCGTYKLKGINGKTLAEYFEEEFAELLGPDSGLDIEMILAMSGMSLETLEEKMTITLNVDGTASSTLQDEEETKTVNGSWELKDDKIFITFEDTTTAFDYVDGQLTAEMDGQTMIFGR